jgi:t-SNARE complex subunit (syntaxin)
MKYVLWLLLLICTAFAVERPMLKEEAVVVATSKEEVAAGILLSLLAADEDDKEGKKIAESYLNTQMGFGTTETDEKEKEEIRKAVRNYVQEMKKLNAKWESDISDAERLKVTQDIQKLQIECSKPLFKTKAVGKLKQIENAHIESEQ